MTNSLKQRYQDVTIIGLDADPTILGIAPGQAQRAVAKISFLGVRLTRETRHFNTVLGTLRQIRATK
jgi:hypothetical protein